MHPLKDKLVLLVDDNPSLLDATRAGLVKKGFTVRAVDGAEAAMEAMQALTPSVVVSDLVMPGTNGFELFERMKQVAAFRHIPFVFLTGVDDYYARKFGKDMGGAAYLTKPVDLDELERILMEKLGE
jgi:DNA-binding response OmpR family regulator